MTVEEWKRKNPPIRRKPLTNADRIRAMTDEELANHIAYWSNCGANNKTTDELVACWLDWLKTEVGNDGR